MYDKIKHFVDFLCDIIQRFLPKSKVEQLGRIQVGKSEEVLKREYSRNLLKYMGIILAACMTLMVLSVLTAERGNIIKNGYLMKRQEPYGNSTSVKLEADIAGNSQDVAIEIAPREYSAEELKAKFGEAKKYILAQYLGENPSADQVSKDLNLVSAVPESAIQIEWQTDSGQLVGEGGTIQWDLIESDTPVEITAILRYGEEVEHMPIELTLQAQHKSEEEQLWADWQKEQNQLEEETASEEYLKLPEKINGQAVSYQYEKIASWKYILFVGLAAMLFVPLVLDSRIRQRLEYRETELRLDYPEMLEQFILLMGAGLTIRGAWHKIALEYQKKYESGNRKYRFVYEEMLVTMRELESGMSERKAYELFGKRTGIMAYMRFSTLLVQNLRKGSADLLRLLEYEAVDAFRERKESAKKLGEEASTKLLMPMLLMLAVVLTMIIYAAFRSM